MNISKKIKISLGILAVLLILVCFCVKFKTISDRARRSYLNFFSRQPRSMMIEMYAGCQPRTMMEETSDEGFSNIWHRDTAEYNFDAKDVYEMMMDKCPPRSEGEIRKGYDEYNKETGYKYFNYDENEKLIEKEIKMSVYRRKFINREFSALKQ